MVSPPLWRGKEEATTTKEDKVAQTVEATKRTLASSHSREGARSARMDRGILDLMISWAGAVVAIALVALGAAAIYGGSFALENVRDRLEPQRISFPPAAAMTPEERAEVGEFAGHTHLGGGGDLQVQVGRADADRLVKGFVQIEHSLSYRRPSGLLEPPFVWSFH